MNEQWRVLLFSLAFVLGGCAVGGASGVFDSHHEFHVKGIAPERFTQPWVLKR